MLGTESIEMSHTSNLTRFIAKDETTARGNGTQADGEAGDGEVLNVGDLSTGIGVCVGIGGLLRSLLERSLGGVVRCAHGGLRRRGHVAALSARDSVGRFLLGEETHGW